MDASQKWQHQRLEKQSFEKRWKAEEAVVSGRRAGADVFGINYIPSNLSVTPSSCGNSIRRAEMLNIAAHRSSLKLQKRQPFPQANQLYGHHDDANCDGDDDDDAKTDLASSECELGAAPPLSPAARMEDIKRPSSSWVPAASASFGTGCSSSASNYSSSDGPFVKGMIERCLWLLSRANKDQRVPILVLLILTFVQISGSQLTALPRPTSSCCPVVASDQKTPAQQQQRQQQTIISRESSDDDSNGDCGGCDLSGSSLAIAMQLAGGKKAQSEAANQDSANNNNSSSNRGRRRESNNNNMHDGNFYHDDDNQSANQSKSFTAQRLTPLARVDESQSDNVTGGGGGGQDGNEGDGDENERKKAQHQSIGCRRSQAAASGSSSPSTNNNRRRLDAAQSARRGPTVSPVVRRDSADDALVAVDMGAATEPSAAAAASRQQPPRLDGRLSVDHQDAALAGSFWSWSASKREHPLSQEQQQQPLRRRRRRATTYGLDGPDRDPIGVVGVSRGIDMAPSSPVSSVDMFSSAAAKSIASSATDSDRDREDDINNANNENGANDDTEEAVAAATNDDEAPSLVLDSAYQTQVEARRRLNDATDRLIVSEEQQSHHQEYNDHHVHQQQLGSLIEAEDDELFLVPGSRVSMSAQEEEYYRQRRSSGIGRGKVQTIYFGGFFPWLTDEDHRQVDGGLNDERLSKMKQQQHHHQQQQQQPPHKATRKKRPQRKQEQQYENSTTTTANTTATAGQQPEVGHQLGRFILPAVRLALDHINNNSSILSSYRLEIVPRDTQCNATISLKEFFDMVYEAPKKMLLYGDACRVSTDPIAKASYFFDLIQISYADTDPIYTIENYPNFFRVVPSENALSLARIPFIRHFNWTRVGTIYQNLPRYSLPHSKLLTDLERFKIVIKQSVSLPGSVDGLQNRDLGDELRKLKEKDVRIILGNFDEEWALLLFCEAFREKMTGRKYQWILTGVSEDKLWRYYKSKGSECSEEELLIAMDGYIITDITPVTRSQRRTISGMMAHEYSNEYKRRAHDMNISIDENKFYGYVYDGIWAIALALHKVDYQLKYYNRLVEAGKAKLDPELEGLTSLLDFDYHRPIWVKLIRGALNRTRFNGVTGTVSFQKNERPGLISFSQFQAFRGMSEVIIGSYDALNDHLDLKVGFPISWRGPSPPIDYTIQRVTPFRINRTLFVIISILALFGIVLAFVFLTINIKFRNQRYIKMSSPYLNNLIIIGCILTYTSVIILGLDSGLTSEYNFPYICNARAWVLMAGFTLAFGSMFSKTFRVHSIFTNIKLHKKVIKDYKLFMVVFILLTFDVCILIVWQYFDPFYRETNNGTSIQDSDNEDVIIVPEMEHCQSKRMTIFLSVIYVYKGLLMAFGCFLAWETRHVSIPALNDSKYIGLSVYNVVIMCVIGASLSFVLRDQQDASFVIISIFIIFCSTTTLCLVFVPKIIELKQNPRAGDHRVRATLKTFKKNYREEALGAAASCRDVHGNIIGRGYGVNLNERIKILLDENVKQRSTLKEKTYELEALTYKYRKIQNMIQSGQYQQALNTTGGNISQATGLDRLTTTLSPKDRPIKMSISFQTQFDKDKLKSIDRTTENATDGLTTFSRSPQASNAAHIITTNTTSTNNTSDNLVTDYSSCKMISNNTSSTNLGSAGVGKRALVAFDCPVDNKKISTGGQDVSSSTVRSNTSKHYAQNLLQANNVGQQQLADPTKKTVRVGVRNCRYAKRSPKCTTDSSYCSMGVDYELSGIRRSQDDLDLFTVFSYISNTTDVTSHKQDQRSVDKSTERSFNRWSEGPFCTLMVRNKDMKSTKINSPGGAIQRNRPVKVINKPIEGEKSEDLGSSCPDIAAKLAPKASQVCSLQKTPIRQISQQSERLKGNRLIESTVGKTNQLSRTLSMIEYLGMDEFDMIARRHDKLIRRRNNKRTNPCCYNNQQQQSCRICAQTTGARATIGTTRQEHEDRCQVQTDRPTTYSSNDPLNSTDLVQTSSRLSCSSCCSLATQTYASQSDVFDETSLSATSESSRTPSTSASESVIQYLSQSQSSTSSNSDTDRLDKDQVRYCRHHAQVHTATDSHQQQQHLLQANQENLRLHHHHHHHQHHHHPHQLGNPTSSSTSSSSSIYRDQQINRTNSAEHSLCTSGVLYRAPGSREDGNTSNQPDQSGDSLAGRRLVGVPSTISSGDTPTIGEEVPDELRQKLLIKCDILENL